MNDEHDDLFRKITRFALPAIILVFYLTATLHFGNTPDSTYTEILRIEHRVMHSDGTTPGVPWTLLIGLGERLHLDPLLVAKVLSLFFSCVVIMFGFLVAQQILMDRLLGFSAALLVAVQPWLLQLAGSGSSMPLAAALTLATLFFMLRNEYLLAAVFAGVCGLSHWQGAVLLLFVAADALVNSLSVRRGIKVAASVLMIGVATWLPWILYASTMGDGGLVPIVIPVEQLQPPSLPVAIVLALACLLILVASILGLRAGSELRPLFRMHAVPFALLVWLAVAGFQDWTFAIAGLLMLFAYAMLAVRVLLMITNRERTLYATSFVLVGLILATSQWDFHSRIVPSMHAETIQAQELVAIAYWIRSHASDSTVVASERAPILAYYSGKDILLENNGVAELIVASSAPSTEYRMIFDPGAEHPGQFIGATTHWKMWRKI
ncbi:MAG: hypothetical protein ACKVRP_10160 [Bacteroidota bacterium]